jgi:hypothetical protein
MVSRHPINLFETVRDKIEKSHGLFHSLEWNDIAGEQQQIG